MPNAALYGLVGYPLGHSFSQKYFTEKFLREGIAGARYELFPLPDLAAFPALLSAHPDLRGLNVTIPHKEAILSCLHDLDETARAVGAVNVVRIDEGKCIGFNTDVFGFAESLTGFVGEAGLKNPSLRAYILGTGGAARAVAFVLKKRGIAFHVVSRKAVAKTGPSDALFDAHSVISYSDLRHQLSSRSPSASFYPALIINATPVGTFPGVNASPDVPIDCLVAEDLVYDLIYNPAETLLLRRAKAQGASIKNGLEMLHLQADKSWDIWVGG